MKQDVHVTELLPEYALNCLDAEEAAMVAEHLIVCEQCRKEFEAFQTVTDQLAFAVPEVQPSPKLKTRILKNIQSEKRSFQERAFFRDWWQRLSAFFRPIAPVWNVASVAIIVVLGISTLMFWQRINSLEQFYHTQDFQLVKLQCTHVFPGATGQVVMSRDGEVGMLAVAHLPVLDPGYTYQVWLIQNGQRTSGGTFLVNQQGYGMLNVVSPQSLLDCHVSITVEPVQGSIEPTGKTVLQSITI
jgi:anti-sigma-K factor RskA